MRLLPVQAGVVECERGPVREALRGSPCRVVEGLRREHDPQRQGPQNRSAGPQRQHDAGLEAVPSEGFTLGLPGCDAVDLLIGELVQIHRPARSDHLRDRMRPVWVYGGFGSQLDEDVGDLGAPTLRRQSLNRAVSHDDVHHRDVAEGGDRKISQMLGALPLIQRVLHERARLRQQLGGGLLPVQADPQARHPKPHRSAGDGGRHADQALAAVDALPPEDGEGGQDQTEDRDHRRLGERGAHRGDHGRNRKQADHHLVSRQHVDHRDRARQQHRHQRRSGQRLQVGQPGRRVYQLRIPEGHAPIVGPPARMHARGL